MKYLRLALCSALLSNYQYASTRTGSTMSQEYEDFRDDEELDDFIVSDEEPQNEQESENEQPEVDRLANLTSSLNTKESPTSRLLKAHVSILVSALGGPDHTTENSTYKLGHDALACLKDLKRWIRSMDEKNGTSDVALACAECGLVKNDLTVILCQWDKPAAGVTRSKTTDKIMLACLELLVLLTWPTEVNRKTLLKDYTARTNTRRAQLGYKQHILTYKGGRTLKAVIRLGLAALLLPKDEREPRDTNILRLILFFIRNVLFIEPLPASKSPKAITNSSDLPNGVSAEDIALPAVITAFDKNKVLLFLNSVAHSVLSDITDESFGLLTMECLSLLLRGVKVEEFFVRKSVTFDTQTTTVPPASSAAGLDLSDLLREESRRKTIQQNGLSTRHGRFGTLLSIQSGSNNHSYVISGQKALASTYDSLQKLDQSKNWHKSSAFKYDSDEYVKKPTVYLGTNAATIMSRFVNQLLISGSFNKLHKFVSQHLTNIANDNDLGRRGILDAIDGYELASFFLTTAWFFRFKRQKLQHFEEQKLLPDADEDGLDYGSVGAALSEVNFILLISYFRSSFESKDYDSLHVAMICFREMLLISHSIFSKERSKEEIALESESDINEDRELAEGIIRKLFSQKQFLDLCVNIPKQASKHSPAYLSVVVSSVHILLKSFETLANEDVKLFIKTRRRMKKLDKSSGLSGEMDRAHWHLIDRGSDDDDDDEEEFRFITQERKLDFKNTEVKFFHPDTVSTHIKYLSRYEDLTHEEIKKGLAYFHRLFVVRKDYAALYRLDFMDLIYNLRNYLPKSSSIRRHADEFILYFMKKFKIALERFPVPLELLFSRFENIEYKGFLSTGDLEALAVTEKIKPEKALGLPLSSYFAEDAPQPRAAPILRFIDVSLSLDAKIGALVYHIIKKKNSTKILTFLLSELDRIAPLVDRGISLIALRLNLANRRLLISEPHVRLLLETIGFYLSFLQNDETVLGPSVTSSDLKEASASIAKWLKLHEVGVGDIEPFLDQFQREFYSQEEVEYGEECLAALKAGKPIDTDKGNSLNIDDSQLHKLMGMAKRREYDADIATQYYDDEDDKLPSEDEQFTEVSAETRKLRSRRSRAADRHDDLESTESITKGRRTKKQLLHSSLESDDELSMVVSAELVHDSDDDSDHERNNAFFEREEKLRQLLASTGGITSKEHLKLFKESWSKMVGNEPNAQVKTIIERATGLFVDEDLDHEDTVFSQNDTPVTAEGSLSDEEPSMKRAHEEVAEPSMRKRRLVIEDDDEE